MRKKFKPVAGDGVGAILDTAADKGADELLVLYDVTVALERGKIDREDADRLKKVQDFLKGKEVK